MPVGPLETDLFVLQLSKLSCIAKQVDHAPLTFRRLVAIRRARRRTARKIRHLSMLRTVPPVTHQPAEVLCGETAIMI